MSLSDLASLAGVVSGLAVLVSLIFLWFQLRQLGAQVAQAEANQRAMINEAYVTRVTDQLIWQAEPQMARLVVRVSQGETAFTAEELAQLNLLFRAATLSTQAVTQHYEAGLIDQASFDAAILSFKTRYLNQPVFRVIWARQASMTSPSFRAVVDAMLRETPAAVPVDIAARFQHDLAELIAQSAAPVV